MLCLIVGVGLNAVIIVGPYIAGGCCFVALGFIFIGGTELNFYYGNLLGDAVLGLLYGFLGKTLIISTFWVSRNITGTSIPPDKSPLPIFGNSSSTHILHLQRACSSAAFMCLLDWVQLLSLDTTWRTMHLV